MTPTEMTIRPMARTYLFLLRLFGWMGLATLPLFAFAWASGYARDPDMLPLALAVVAPGALLSLFLAGTPDRPTFLLRPTQFLKAFFVCGFFLSLASTPVYVQVAFMITALDAPRLFADIGLSVVLDWSAQAVDFLNSIDPSHKVEAHQVAYVTAAFAALIPFAVVSQINAFVVWFARFPKVEKSAAQAAYEETLARAEAQQKEDAKADAMEAMRQRLARPRAT